MNPSPPRHLSSRSSNPTMPPVAALHEFSEEFPTASSGTTPTSRPHPSRRETILSLVEMLLQNSEAGYGPVHSPTFEDDRDVPTVDEHLQVVGAEAFHRFQKRINNLDRELRNFANAARQLGSSVAILSSSYHLRGRLAHILFLYNDNAAHLFPRKVSRAVPQHAPEARTGRRRRGIKPMRYKAPPHVARPIVSESLDPETFPDQLEMLAEDVATFLNCLNEFPEFTDEGVNVAIQAFEGDLKYWSSCLKVYAGQFRTPSVQRYLHDLSIEMGEHIDSITTSLSMFIEVGVPTIRFAQKHGATNLLNLSTVATFFSAVTATTMQFSFDQVGKTTADLVNCFWFASLVFSIAAAVNSLLGLTWKQAMYRSPGHRVPWWVLIWIKRSPLVFLVMSVACFSVGLCLFAYSSKQSSLTSTVTTVLTAFTSFGLCAVSAWFASERWIFIRHRGQKWLSDALLETRDQFMHTRGVELLRKGWRALKRQSNKTRKSVMRQCLYLLNCCRDPRYFESDPEALPTFEDERRNSHLPRTPIKARAPSASEASSQITAEPKSSDTLSVPSPPMTPSLERDSPFDTPVSNAKQLWKNAVRTVQMKQYLMPLVVPQTPTVMGRPAVPFRQRTNSSSGNGHPEKRKPMELVVRSRITAIQPKLVELDSVQDIDAHQALVRHLQFSPDGKYLATSSWDRTSGIYLVKEKDEYGPLVSLHRTLAHPLGFVGQVAWSPQGEYLLTKLPRAIKLWTSSDGVCKKTIDRPAGVEAIAWFPDGKSFLSVEGSMVVRLDIHGTVEAEYDFGRIKLFDVAVTPDGKRLLGVGPLMESPSGLQPKKSRAEKRLVVYNIMTGHVEIQTPVLNDVRDITLERTVRQNEFIALVSYENKAPPQLWKLDLVKDKESSNMVARLILRHTYMPKTSVDFAGPSYFGGKNQELVLSAGKAGDIHIWDTESGAVVHHIRAQQHGGDLTALAWNHAAEDPFMFATGSHDGGLRIWTRPDPEHNDMELTPIAMQMHVPSRSRATSFAHTTRPNTPSRHDTADSITMPATTNRSRGGSVSVAHGQLTVRTSSPPPHGHGHHDETANRPRGQVVTGFNAGRSSSPANRETISHVSPGGRHRGGSVSANAQHPSASQLKDRLALITAKAREAQANQANQIQNPPSNT
ncbi:hypothetical protein BDQ17DRAFT_1347270 [Cyathus striatus]|nr:hypothetical protein BDQ17DRAFT_1347270 [Cyathus striatus]